MGIFKPKNREGWVAAVWHKGRKVAQKYFPTKGQAKEWHDKQLAKAYDGYLERPEEPLPDAPVTIRALAGRWLTDLKQRKRSDHTIRGYKERLRTSVLPAMGSVLLADVTAAQVERVFEKLRTQGVKSINYQRILGTWRAMFRWAVSQNLTRLDPTVKVPKMKETPESESRYLTREEVRKVIDATSGQVQLLCRLAFHTGMRPRELEAARMEWVDLARRIIRVPNTLDFTPKGKAARSIPIDDELVAALAALKRTDGPVLVSKRTKGHFTYKGTRKLWLKAMRASGVQFAPYDARHTYCSNLISAGVPLHEVQKVMGHRRIETTMRYAHLAPDYLERVRWAASGGRLHAVKPQPLEGR